jgi:hypothetical protein
MELPKIHKNIDLENWFDLTFNKKTLKKSIIHVIGDSGIGKKKTIIDLCCAHSVNIVDINCLHGTSHYDIKKKDFIPELKTIMTHRNIDFFLSGRQNLILIHNLHTIRDKKFLDQLFELNTLNNITSPVICVLNKFFISERLISHICKKCYALYLNKKSFHELRDILISYHKKHFPEGSLKLGENFIKTTVDTCDGNIHKMFILWKDYILTIHATTTPYDTDYAQHPTMKNTKKLVADISEPENWDFQNSDTDLDLCYKENTKTLICNCFETLCAKDVPFYKKIDTIKVHGSLLKLLMSTHVCNGLEATKLSYIKKLNICIQLMSYLSRGDSVKGTYNTNYSQILQCIIPTNMVSISTIKSLILPSFPSTSNNQVLRMHPHNPDQAIYISHFMIKYFTIIFDNHSLSKKSKSNDSHYLLKTMEDWKNVVHNFNKELMYEINLRYFKLFPEFGISKKKINRFFKLYEEIL